MCHKNILLLLNILFNISLVHSSITCNRSKPSQPVCKFVATDPCIPRQKYKGGTLQTWPFPQLQPLSSYPACLDLFELLCTVLNQSTQSKTQFSELDSTCFKVVWTEVKLSCLVQDMMNTGINPWSEYHILTLHVWKLPWVSRNVYVLPLLFLWELNDMHAAVLDGPAGMHHL